MNNWQYSKPINLLLVLCLGLGLFFSGCAKKPLPWSRDLDRKALKLFNEGQDYFNRGKYWSARRRYNKVIRKFKRSRYADNAQFMIGETYAVKRRYEIAVEAYHKVTERYPASELLSLVAEKEYAIAMYFWEDGAKKTAIDIFSKVVDAYPYNDLAPKAQYRIADYYYTEKKDYAEAIVQYERLIDEFPQGGAYLAEAVFRLGISHLEESLMWALDQESTDLAILQFKRIINEFPQSPYVAKARETLTRAISKKAKKEYKTGYFYYWEGKYEAARLYYDSVLETYSDTPWVADSIFDIGRTYYKEKKWLLAQEYFNKVQKEYPKRVKLVAKAAKMLEKCARKIRKQ